uniref:Exostosin GT47 domain-containing protein n=1 Tax=Kalanchoe fedtschenkoi TaxID=63787 RepID=A0A7N0URQ5_KALFE
MPILKSIQVDTRRLIWLFGALFMVVAVFQFIELPDTSPVSSLIGLDKVHSAAKNVSQVGDSSFECHTESNSDSEKEKPKDERTDLGEVPSPNSTSVVNGALKIIDGVESGESGTDDKDVASAPALGSHPSYVEVVVAPALPPLGKKMASENEEATFTSPPRPPETAPSTAPPAEENIKKNEASKAPEISATPTIKEETKPLPEVVSIKQMNELLHQSRHSYSSMKPRWPSTVDEDILSAKLQIENAPFVDDPTLYAPLYRNVSMFRRSYELMENMLKVHVYREGKSPIFHRPPLRGIYASEGWFMKHMEANKKFVTKDPAKAHLFYFPFSSRQLEETMYVRDSHSMDNLVAFLNDYLTTIKERYPYWNRTGGADHFAVACHDWAAFETTKVMPDSIRALCNSDVKEGYKFGKDVALAETTVRSPKNLLADIGGKPPSQRDTLAFFAGRMHGYLRPILLQHWHDKDPDMKIFGKLPKAKKQKNYIQYMKSSKYCICPRGYEVNSPRVVEAIFFECVPVIISDNFVPPFFEILNWESFAVFVPEKDVPNLKTILLSISDERYTEMQQRVKQVQQHFLWHSKPEKYDIFHMILHSVWFNRVFTFQP